MRPGAVRHDVTGAPNGTHVMAFQQGARWTVVAWNEGVASATVGLTLPGNPKTVHTAVETSPTSQLTPVAAPGRTADGTWVAHIAPKAIVTYTFG